jgi:hypothetical protein
MGLIFTPQEKAELRYAYKKLKFWYNVLLETEYLNDLEHRKELASSIGTLKKLSKKKNKRL